MSSQRDDYDCCHLSCDSICSCSSCLTFQPISTQVCKPIVPSVCEWEWKAKKFIAFLNIFPYSTQFFADIFVSFLFDLVAPKRKRMNKQIRSIYFCFFFFIFPCTFAASCYVTSQTRWHSSFNIFQEHREVNDCSGLSLAYFLQKVLSFAEANQSFVMKDKIFSFICTSSER